MSGWKKLHIENFITTLSKFMNDLVLLLGGLLSLNFIVTYFSFYDICSFIVG